MSDEKLREYFEYLDALRDTGLVNMMGAALEMVREFEMDIRVARNVLRLWQETFDDELPVDERVLKARVISA